MIITRTPLRISFFGGGTDLPSYYKKNEFGACLSCAIKKYIYVSIKKQNQFFKEKIRLNYSETELVNDIEEIKNPIIKESLKFMEIDEKMYISTISDIPASSGLGSSSSFCVGLLNALYAYKGISVHQARLAEEAAHIEIDRLSRPMGKQDHYPSAIGGFNLFKFFDNESVSISPVSLFESNLNDFEKCICIFWTGITRPSESVLKGQDSRYKENQENLTILRDQALEIYEMINKKIDIQIIGDNLNKNWALKKTLSKNISNKSFDKIYNAALKNGAIGGKISGAGGGGFFTFFCHPKLKNKLRKEMQALGLLELDFKIEQQGSQVYLRDNF